MTEKRFKLIDGIKKGTHSGIWDNQKQHNMGIGDELWLGEVVGMLNEGVILAEETTNLKEENEQLKKENKILNGLYDLDTLSDKFYVDGHWLKNKHSMGIIANMFDYHEAHLVCGILNDLLPYKLLVRKHKQDLESIYGKSIKEQLEEVIK